MKWFKYHTDSFSQSDFEHSVSLMTAKRKERIERITHKDTLLSTVFGEWTAKNALSEYCDIPIEKIVFYYTEFGKPYIKELPIHFNISHSGNWIVVAIDDAPIGIDIEVLRPIDLCIHKRLCTESDMQYLFGDKVFFDNTNDPDTIRRFFEIWTAKEAYFKKIGTGITDLKSVSYSELQPIHFYEDGCIITIIKD